uniref:peptidylprolyl isomerase n=1 Tax=Oryza glumipatula TaxID=40148 RepID=A0A0D9YAL7_9ORYZ
MAPLPELGEPDKSFHNLWDEEEDDDDDDDDEGEVERLPVPPPHSGLLKWTVLKSIDGNDEECRAFKAWSEFQQSISGFILQDDFLVFVSSRENGIPLTFILGQDDVMHGFDFAVSSMLPGEKAIFTIPSELAMTKTGSPARIPSNNVPLNKTLWFEIELINLFTITDIFDDEGILKKIVKSGVPNRSQFRWSDVDSVFVRYNACLKDGTLVSKSEGVEFSLADDAFGEQGRPSLGDEAAIPPNATLYVHLKFLSWVRLRHTWEDRTISKKNLSVGNSLRIHKKSQGVVKGEVIDGQDKALMTTKEEVALFVMCALLLIMLLVLLFIVKVLDYFPEKKDVKQERTAQEFLEDSPEVDSAGEMDRGPKVEVILLQAGYCRKLKHGHRHRGNDLFVPGVAGANASQPASTPVAAASAGGGATPATSAATANRNAVQISSGTVRTDRGFSFLCFRSSPTK